MNQIKKILAVIFLFSASVTLAQSSFDCLQSDPGAQYRDHQVDIIRMKLEVNFEPAVGKVKGKVTHYFVPLRKKVDTLFFDGPDITIQSCTVNGKTAQFKTNDKGVTVFFSPALTWDKNDSLTFVYEATPRKGIYFIGWNDTNNLSRKQIWTQGQGVDNRYWIPMYDAPNDKYITETITTFDKDYNVLSNGMLLNGKKFSGINQPQFKPVVNKDGVTRTWHYRMPNPHAGYLLMLAIDKYAVKTSTSKSGVKISNWYYPEMEDRYEPTFSQTAQIMDFLEDEIGMKYTWGPYANVMVQDFLYGAMENTTATVFGDFYFIDKRGYLDRNYNGVNCHEMTHQWFGDLITLEDWNDAWLQESFATFYPKLYFKKYLGEDNYEWQRRGEHNTALDASKYNRNPIRSTQAGTARNYPKGSSVLDMLRHYVGNEAFKKVIQYYLKQNEYANVITSDFETAFKDVLGIDLKWFFDEWIYKGGEPAYNITYEKVSVHTNPQLMFTVQQTQKIDEVSGLFKMPVAVEIHYTDGTNDSSTIWVKNQSETFMLPMTAGKTFSFILFDPGSWIIKSVTIKRTLDELKNQLLDAPLMIDRYDALAALRDTAIEKKRDVLLNAYRLNSFHAIRAEVVAQLSNDNNPASISMLKDAFADKDVNVRMSAVNNLNVSSTFQPFFENALNDSSYNVVRTALQKLVEANPSGISAYLNKTKEVVGLNNEVRLKWLELAIQNNYGDKQNLLNELNAYTSNSYEFRTRTGAATALKNINYCDAEVVKNLFNAALSSNSRMAGPCVTVLDYFFAQAPYKSVIRNQYASIQWKDWEKKILEKYK